MKTPKYFKWLFVTALLVGMLILAGCSPEGTPCPDPDCPECPESPECPECEECPEVLVKDVPFADAWAGSGHADAESESFRHWDEDDPPEVSTRCARCHSSYGYLDYLGADGTEAWVVDNAAATDSVINCVTCHNDVTMGLNRVIFPSTLEITGLGDEARCMQCHQGRSSTTSVETAITEAGVGADEVTEDLRFINIHYYAAAATQYGTFAMGGYEYEGKMYDARFEHVPEYDTCDECHNPHTLELNVEECATCHTGVASAEDLMNVRLVGSMMDYDGDGDVSEGVYYEIMGLQEILYGAIQAYAADTAGTAIVYDSHAYPYFFIDTNEDGEASEDEANYGNQYASWTPRLVRAAYNFQTSHKDPGAFAHGGKYIIQLLYDSIEDLDPALVEGLHRGDAGHFDGSTEAWRHWDEDGEVPGRCARCHSASGLPTYLDEGVNVAEPLSNGMLCTTCHTDFETFGRYEVGEVEFPSGAMLGFEEDMDSNLCLNCHQGRASGASVSGATAGLGDDEMSEDLRFINVHYFAAGATLFGSEAAGVYEFDGQEYAGRFEHVAGFDTCAGCHDAHGLGIVAEDCATCHPGVEDVMDIRVSETDFDGDGDVEEGIAGEIATMADALYAEILAYSADMGAPVVYESHSYPYFFADTNGNGEPDPDEANYGNRYASWTPRLLRAAYNYQYALKDPGGFAHNGTYIIQVLYDNLVDMGADVSGMTRP